jgi:hypothetical protein
MTFHLFWTKKSVSLFASKKASLFVHIFDTKNAIFYQRSSLSIFFVWIIWMLSTFFTDWILYFTDWILYFADLILY